MIRKQLITACIFSILISIAPCSIVYPDTKISNTVKSSLPLNFIDKILYKIVVLPGGDKRIVLVNRITGEVKYILVNDNQWMLLTGTWKKQCQTRYNAKTSLKK